MCLTMQELKDAKAMVVKIGQTYREDMTDEELYDAVRGCWRVNVERAERAAVVLGVYQGKVIAVYHNPEWELVTNHNWRYIFATRQIPSVYIGRYFFTSDSSARGKDDRFYGRHLPTEMRRQGNANPIQYGYE